MEETRLQEPIEASATPGDDAQHRSGPAAMTQFGTNIIEAEDLDQKKEMHQQKGSPVRTIPLLPPFGVPSHLPTPQSPGNLAGYLGGPVESPLPSDHSRGTLSPQFPNFRSPPRPESSHPPKTPQRESSTSTPKIISRTFPSQFGADSVVKENVADLARTHSSQIATPSPEITRIRRASAHETLSDTETIATPSTERRSSSHPYNGNITLPTASIIPPANSSHSTMYHASPEIHSGKQIGPSYNVSYNMTTLVSEHSLRNTIQASSTYDHTDPFIDANEGRKEGPTVRRYPSPPISSGHDSNAPRLRAQTVGNDTSSVLRLVASPSESSAAPSFGSPVKTEVKDIVMHAPRPAELNGVTPSQAPASPRTPPPLGQTAPCTPPLEQSRFRTPPRIVSGENVRVRQRQAELTGSREVESEKLCPDYLIRAKRARNDPDDEEVPLPREREAALPSLGVTVSPARGRRLKLYRPIPVALGEERRPELDDVEPKTPPLLNTTPLTSAPTLAMHAIDWQTPRPRRVHPIIWTEEDELKKQKRLAAFATPESSRSRRRLKPVDVPGQGRIVIDVTSEETRVLAEAGILDMPPPDAGDDVEIAPADGPVPEWPDSEYPWSLLGQQRHKEEEAEKRKRLHYIERFLDRESESEDDDHDGAAGPSTLNPRLDVNTPSPPRTQRGRGKSISLTATPGVRHTATADRRVFGAANSDAREVLLSKKHIREVAERLRRRRVVEEEEGIVMCICQGADDGRPMVRCDQCRTWYHLVCMDITDVSELGDEWFCWKCAPSTEDLQPAPVFVPTFAPVMPDTPPRMSVGDLTLYQTSLQPSPILDMRTRAPISPSAPPAYISRDRDRERSPPRRPRLPNVLGDPDDPVRGGPSTPYHARSMDSRLYSTPKFYDDYAGDEHMPFDPTSTPSRGLKFPNSVPITPRRPPTWAGQGLLWTTPSGLPRSPQFSSQTPSSSARSLAYSLSTMEDSGGPLTSPWPPDDSPVRRPQKPNEPNFPHPQPRRLLDSPLAARGGGNRPFLLGAELEESPSPVVYAPQ